MNRRSGRGICIRRMMGATRGERKKRGGIEADRRRRVKDGWMIKRGMME